MKLTQISSQVSVLFFFASRSYRNLSAPPFNFLRFFGSFVMIFLLGDLESRQSHVSYRSSDPARWLNLPQALKLILDKCPASSLPYHSKSMKGLSAICISSNPEFLAVISRDGAKRSLFEGFRWLYSYIRSMMFFARPVISGLSANGLSFTSSHHRLLVSSG